MYLRYCSVWLVLALMAGGGCGSGDEIDPWSSCSGKCEGSTTESSLATRYPIYFAHGFKSSGSTWDQVIRLMEQHNPSLSGLLVAGDVDPGGPIVERSQALRRNLQKMLDSMRRQKEPPEGDKYWKINIIAHSMGGLDSRYLVNHPKFNNPGCHTLAPCEANPDMCCYAADASATKTYASNKDAPEPCCSATEEGTAILWTERIASITTLSTPHRGSAFADWGLEFLSLEAASDEKRSFLEKLKEQEMGMLMLQFFFSEHKSDGQVYQDAINTFTNLSRGFNTTTMRPYAEVDKQRIYNWWCALGANAEYCTASEYPYQDELGKVQQPALQDWPRRRNIASCNHLPEVANGLSLTETGVALTKKLLEMDACYNLPGPKHGKPPIFSWAGETCPGGRLGDSTCGDRLTPALAAMYRTMLNNEGPNDGIVSIHSARFGLFMGAYPADHLNWTEMEGLFPTIYKWEVTAPINFFKEWIPRLREAGY